MSRVNLHEMSFCCGTDSTFGTSTTEHMRVMKGLNPSLKAIEKQRISEAKVGRLLEEVFAFCLGVYACSSAILHGVSLMNVTLILFVHLRGCSY